MGMNISGFTNPQTTFNNAFIHSTLSGVGGLNSSPLCVCIAILTLSNSFSIFLPAFSLPTQAAKAVKPRNAVLTNQLHQPSPFFQTTAYHKRAHAPVVTNAPVRRMDLALLISTGETGGGNDWRLMLPTSAEVGAA